MGAQTEESRGARTRGGRGFTLVEVMVAVVIIGVMSGLAISTLSSLKQQTGYSDSVNSVVGSLKQLRAESLSRGANTVFVVDTAGKRYWGLADPAGTFSLATFDPAAPTAGGRALILTGSLTSGVHFGPSTGYGKPLPAPYSGVPAQVACSFCPASSPLAGYGFLTFLPGGGARFADGSTVGGSITLQNDPNVVKELKRTPTVIAINARSATLQTFERPR